jgi:hypothetical protein
LVQTEPPHILVHTRFTLLLLFVLLLVFAENIARIALSIKQAIDLPNLPTSLSPVYVAITSAFWAAGFAACLFGIARLNPWAPKFTIAVSALYEVNLWLNRLAFGRSSEALATVGFHLILTLLFLGAIAGTLAMPGTRRLFADARRYLEWLKRRD